MIAYPDKQRKCQEELESVVSRSRIPTFEDQASLPYISATVRELLRWRPVAPAGESFSINSSKSVNRVLSAVRIPALYERGNLS